MNKKELQKVIDRALFVIGISPKHPYVNSIVDRPSWFNKWLMDELLASLDKSLEINHIKHQQLQYNLYVLESCIDCGIPRYIEDSLYDIIKDLERNRKCI